MKNCIIVICVFFGILSAEGFADTILSASSSSLRNLRIVDLRDGNLEGINQSTGQRVSVQFSEVVALRVDGQNDFNHAEQLFSSGKWNEARNEYVKLLSRNLRSGHWLRRWIAIKLMHLDARLGYFDDLVERYCDLSAEIPEWIPAAAPNPDDIRVDEKTLQRGLDVLRQRAAAAKKSSTRQAILRYINQFTRELPADAVSDSKRVSDNNLSVPSTQPGSWLGEWTELKIKEHSGKQVVQVVESMFAMALRRDLGDLLYYRGKGNLALGDYDLAGLDFLRSAVEFPAGQYAPIALYSAAESAESAGKSEYAKNIYREFIDLYSHVTDHQIIALIQTARKKINVKENEP